MQRIYLIIIVIWALATRVAIAQTSTSTMLPTWAFKWNPVALIDVSTPAWQMGVERRLGNKFSINAEAGYLLNYNNRMSTGIDSRSGVRLRLEGRYYWSSFMNEDVSPFVGIAAVYRYTNDLRRSLVSRYDNAYTEALDFRYIRHNLGGYLTTGGVFRFKQAKKSLEKGTTIYSPVSVELSVGVGLRMTSLLPTDLPNDAEFVNSTGSLLFEAQPSELGSRFVAPSIQLGFKLLYILTTTTKK